MTPFSKERLDEIRRQFGKPHPVHELLSALDAERERADKLGNSNAALDLLLDNCQGMRIRLSEQRDRAEAGKAEAVKLAWNVIENPGHLSRHHWRERLKEIERT